MKMKIIKLCNLIIELSFALLFFLVPLALTTINYELFEFNKMVLIYGLTIIITSAWLIKIIASKELKIQRTPLDIPLILFLISQILSTVFSIDRHVSLFGYYSRFHGGLLSTLSYFLLYYALVSNLNEKKKVFRLFSIALISGFLVAVYGILEHFGIDAKYWVQDVRNRVFSTLGQPNWLAAYLNILLFLTLGLLFSTRSKLKITAYCLLFTVYYTCLLYTKSRSGFAAFTFCFCLYSLLLLIVSFINKNIKTFLELFAVCCLLFAVVTFFTQPEMFNLDKYGYSQVKKLFSRTTPAVNKSTKSLPQGPALEVGGTESGEIRKIVWQGAIDIAFAYPFFGSGVETFAFAYYQFRPAVHNLVSEWDFLYNKAHNEFLNYAATTGLVGLTTYLSIIGLFIFLIVKTLIQTNKKQIKTNNSFKFANIRLNSCENSSIDKTLFLIISLLSAYVTILITNFFGFSVVIVSIYFWLIPAFIFILSDKLAIDKSLVIKFYHQAVNDLLNKKGSKQLSFQKNLSLPISYKQTALIITILLATCYMLLATVRYWQADTKYALALNYDKTSAFPTAYKFLKEAIFLNPNEPVYYDELSYNTANLAYLAFSQKQNQLATQLINETLSSSQKAIKTSPNNITFLKTRTKVFYILSAINEKYNKEALQALLKAKELAPTDAKIFYNLALLYNRVNQKEKALETLKETVALKANYQDARYALGLFLAEKGDLNGAIFEMNYILEKITPDDKQALEKIKEWEK